MAGQILQKVCPGGSTFCLSLPLSFRFTGPLGLSSAFGASWSRGLEGGGGLALGGDIAEDTPAQLDPRDVIWLVSAATFHAGLFWNPHMSQLGPDCRISDAWTFDLYTAATDISR